MVYSFMQLEEDTEIVHSEILMDEVGSEKVKVYFEKPIDGGFKSATCYIPEYRWEKVEGFNDDDINKFQELLESTAHLIIKLARQATIRQTRT